MKKRAVIALILVSLFVLLTSVEIGFMRLGAHSASENLIFLVLLNFNILALLALAFLVGRSLFKLLIERRQKAMGYKFKTKIVAFFVVLTSIPAGLLFLVASGLGSNYIERLFTPQFRQPIEASIELVKKTYDLERARAMQHAALARSGLEPPPYYSIKRLKELPADAPDVVRGAFSGKSEAEVISGQESDTVLAAVPQDPKDPSKGVILVETSISPDMTKTLNGIKTAYEDYLKLDIWRVPIKSNYFLLLGLFTLFVVFASLYFSLRIAGWITGPVRDLAAATEEVAAGNLGVSVMTTRQDEMGLLIGSFNRMVGELKEGKESLEHSYAESDRRRLIMENILSNIQSGVISLDAEGTVQIINPAALRVLGLKAGDVVGMHYSAMLPVMRSFELLDFIKSINTYTLTTMEKEVRANIEGKRFYLKFFVSSLRDSAGQYIGLLVVVDDLTDVVKAQRAIAWQEAARRMAHEIKNPLTPIRLSTERMLKKWQQKDSDFEQSFLRSTETIIREVDGLKRLVDEFSKLGRMPEIKKTPTDLLGVLEEVAALYKDNLKVNISCPGDLPRIELDPEQIKRVMINIFDNASEAMGGGGKIALSVLPDIKANKVIIDVADEGPGIKDELREKLFQPYFSTKPSGTGLGLAIAQRIIVEHGGHISARRNVPRGTIFTIELPMGKAG